MIKRLTTSFNHSKTGLRLAAASTNDDAANHLACSGINFWEKFVRKVCPFQISGSSCIKEFSDQETNCFLKHSQSRADIGCGWRGDDDTSVTRQHHASSRPCGGDLPTLKCNPLRAGPLSRRFCPLHYIERRKIIRSASKGYPTAHLHLFPLPHSQLSLLCADASHL